MNKAEYGRSKSQDKRLKAQGLPKRNTLFVYGILKRKLELDLEREGATYLADASISGANLYAIGGGVGLRFVEDPLRVAYGEIFLIPDVMWKWLDAIENNGATYTRKVVSCHIEGVEGLDLPDSIDAWVYEHVCFHSLEYGSSEFPVIESGSFSPPLNGSSERP